MTIRSARSSYSFFYSCKDLAIYGSESRFLFGVSLADTASLLFGSGLLLLGLGDWYLHPRPQAVVPAVGPELLYNGLD
jgi:hypothetical protein